MIQSEVLWLEYMKEKMLVDSTHQLQQNFVPFLVFQDEMVRVYPPPPHLKPSIAKMIYIRPTLIYNTQTQNYHQNLNFNPKLLVERFSNMSNSLPIPSLFKNTPLFIAHPLFFPWKFCLKFCKNYSFAMDKWRNIQVLK